MSRVVLHRAMAFAGTLAAACALAQSLGPAFAPPSPKVARAEAMQLAPGADAIHIRLPAPDPEAIEALKRANAQPGAKRLEVGFGHEVATIAEEPRLQAVDGGRAARWLVTSEGARALRVAIAATLPGPGVEIRFSGSARPDVVYGPFDAEALRRAGHWSPVLEGDTATVEVLVRGTAAEPALSVERVSHLFVSLADGKAEMAAKAALSCAVNFACRAALDPELAQTGRAVARMTFITSSGGSALCSGTLLNSSGSGSPAPYFYSAAHCFTTQSSASTLTTHWFYEAASCAATSVGPGYVQVAGGSRLLYANPESDVLLVRLNNSPPASATYAGWDAARLSAGTAVTGIHHPQGDLKKVSLGAIAGFDRSVIVDGIATRVQWNGIATGFTEQGSSGSGIFSGDASAGYRLRGGLQGGPLATCTSPLPELYDTYSRFDLAYPYLSQYLNPSAAPALGANALANPGFESGVTAWTQTSTAPASIITNDASVARSGSWYAWLGGADDLTDTLFQAVTIPSGAARLQFWYRINTAETTSSSAFDRLTVSVGSAANGTTLATLGTFSNLDATSGWVQSPVYDLSAFAGQAVRIAFRATTDFSNQTSFRIDDVALNGTQALASGNATALWWNQSESGWGLNVNEQGDIAFATLFTYDAAGAPMWLVMPSGVRQEGAAVFAGSLYRTTGPPFNANPFTPIGASNITLVGDMALDFSASAAMLGYSVNGVYVSKAIEKQLFGARPANCVGTTSSRAGATNYQDLWWNQAESGWGLNITHQGDVIFATLFTYAANGQGMWLVLPAGARQSDGSYSGDLYRTSGPAFNAAPWQAIGFTRVGTMRLRFANGESGTLEYSVDGVSVNKSITRQPISSPSPLCS